MVKASGCLDFLDQYDTSETWNVFSFPSNFMKYVVE